MGKDSITHFSGILAVLQHAHAGPLILDEIFKDGHKSVMSLSMTSGKIFGLVGSNIVSQNHAPFPT